MSYSDIWARFQKHRQSKACKRRRNPPEHCDRCMGLLTQLEKAAKAEDE